jgi:hypothetical protein
MCALKKMKMAGSPLGMILASLCLALSAAGSSVHLVSTADSTLGPPAGGGGDSALPIISRDGQFVLFASTADNLVALGTNRPVPALIPEPINVFVRDRTNGTTALVSVALDGTGGGNADSLPVAISANGRYALFESSASNLVAGDTNNAGDVFVRDLLSGITVLVDTGTNNGFADSSAYNSVMSADGRYVGFVSAADNLVQGDTNGIPDVFVRDMQIHVTTLVSVGATAQTNSLADVGSDTPILTPDGRFVAFYSTAANLAPGVATAANIYLRDLASNSTICVSSGALPALQAFATATNAVSFNHAISDDGRFVAFEASAFLSPLPATSVILRYDAQTGLTDVLDTNAVSALNNSYQEVQNLSMTPDGRFVAYVANALDTSGDTTSIRLWDAQSGSNILVSVNGTDSVLAGSVSDLPLMDASGHFVAFLSSAPDLVTNERVGDFHLYVRDVQAGITTLVDADTNGIGSLIDPATSPAFSGDGRLLVFAAQDGSLVPVDRNRAYDVFASDWTATAGTELISLHDPGLPSLSPDGQSTVTASSSSFDGRVIAFWSQADDLGNSDTNGLRDIYVRDMLTGTNALVSVDTNGFAGAGLSTEPAISADGRYVGFSSFADNLTSGDINRSEDVFVRDLQSRVTVLASVSASGTGPGNADSFSPLISSNGQFVLFHSRAGDLSPGMVAGTENLFLRDLQNHSTYALSTNGVSGAVMTPDGKRVAYITNSRKTPPSPDRLYVWDSGSSSVVYSLNGTGFGALGMSADGRQIAYTTNSTDGGGLWGADPVLNTNWAIASYRIISSDPPRLSADGQFVAHVEAVGAGVVTNQIYLYDFQTGTNALISQSDDGSGPADGNSDAPEISPDGRFVAYRSAADNLVPGDTNGVPDIFLHDVVSGTTTLLTASRFGAAAGNNRSLTPVFSGNGQILFLNSWASDLVQGDFNNNEDVLAFDLYGGTVVAPFPVRVQSASSPPATWLSWPIEAGKSYHVQFKQNLNDAVWQELTGQISILGDEAQMKDERVSASRFYRVVAY